MMSFPRIRKYTMCPATWPQKNTLAEKGSHTVFLGELGVCEPSERRWKIKKVANDRPAWWPRRVRKPSSPLITMESAASNEEREKNRHVDNMHQRKHGCDKSETEK